MELLLHLQKTAFLLSPGCCDGSSWCSRHNGAQTLGATDHLRCLNQIKKKEEEERGRGRARRSQATDALNRKPEKRNSGVQEEKHRNAKINAAQLYVNEH